MQTLLTGDESKPLRAVQSVLKPSLQAWRARPALATLAIRDLGNAGQAVIASHVLLVLRANCIESDLRHHNSAINACGKNMWWQLALKLLRFIPTADLEPDCISFNSGITACEKGSHWQLALRLLDLMPSRAPPDEVSYNSAISACEKGGQWQLAVNFLSSMPAVRVLPCVISFNAATSACEKGKRWQDAIRLLSSMHAAKQFPDEISHNAAISASAACGEWRVAICLLGAVPTEALSTISYNAAIEACAVSGQWQIAVSLLGQMRAACALADTISFNASISACEKSNQWQCALKLLYLMPSNSLLPNTISYSAAISACEKGSQWELALSLLGSMPLAQVNQNRVSYNAAIAACQKSGLWEVAVDILRAMFAIHMVPDVVSYTAAIFACENAGEWHPSMELLSHLTAQAVPGVLVGTVANTLRKKLGRDAALQLLTTWQGKWQCEDNSSALEIESALHIGVDVIVLAQGRGVIAVSKPEGVTTEAVTSKLWHALLHRNVTTRSRELCIISRLDFRTSGVLPLATQGEGSAAAHWMQAQFASRLVQKEYLCLCEGVALGTAGCTGSISAPLLTSHLGSNSCRSRVSCCGREAITEYHILARYLTAGHHQPHDCELILLLVRPLTGRTHQIRVHMAHLCRPLVGDHTYGALSESILPASRLFLHCRCVRLQDLDGNPFAPRAVMPTELTAAIDTLESLREPKSIDTAS